MDDVLDTAPFAVDTAATAEEAEGATGLEVDRG